MEEMEEVHKFRVFSKTDSIMFHFMKRASLYFKILQCSSLDRRTFQEKWISYKNAEICDFVEMYAFKIAMYVYMMYEIVAGRLRSKM